MTDQSEIEIRSPDGQTTILLIGGQSETAYGIACMQRDGVWRIFN